jgi:hypothetical protein
MTDAEVVILPKGHPAVTPSGQDGRADGGSGRGRGMSVTQLSWYGSSASPECAIYLIGKP